MESSFRKSLSILILLTAGFSQAPCFAVPSRHLLVELTRNAVDLRKNGLPVLLTDTSRNASFLKVIGETLKELESETYQGVVQDRTTLASFLRDDLGLKCDDCNQTVHQLTLNLLFRRADTDLNWLALVGVDNPSYGATLAVKPEAILNYDCSIHTLVSILSKGRIGLIREEIRAAKDESLEILSHLLRGRGPTSSNGTFTQISSNQIELNEQPLYSKGRASVRLILKNDLLKRWDFHISYGWPGGKFVTRAPDSDQVASGDRSFGPGEIDAFLSYRDLQMSTDTSQENEPWRKNRNELIFYNPIPSSEIREIQVAQEGAETVGKILVHFHLNVPVRVIDLPTSDPWDDEASLIARELEATSEWSPTPQLHDFTDLQPIVDKLLTDPETRVRFESLDPSTQEENMRRYGAATDTKDARYLDPQFNP